jgi:N-acetylneuraminate synthase
MVHAELIESVFKLSDKNPPIVVAEIGINHEGSLEAAIQMADAAIDAGALFIKHQTHIPDAEMSLEAKDAIPGNADVSIYEVISRCTLSEADEKALMDHVTNRGAIFFSTPFSKEAADRLHSWNVPLFKIGSGECNNYPLVEYVAAMGKPVILSTGMNTITSIRTSVEILRTANVPFALLHTTNLYPTPSHLLRLGGITRLREEFPDVVVGLSDHSLNNNACLAAVALGAQILERHFTDTKDRPGPDIVCSMDGEELKALVKDSNEVFIALGGAKEPASEEQVTMAFAFASVVATRDILQGETLSLENLWVKRPWGGDFGPESLISLVGKKANSRIPANTQLRSHQVGQP